MNHATRRDRWRVGFGLPPIRRVGESGPARTAWRRAGLPMPSRGLTGVFALTIIGLIAFLNDGPGHPHPPTRLIRHEPGTSVFGFAVSPDGKTIATTRSDGRVSLHIRGIERILDLPSQVSRGLSFSPDSRFLAVAREEPGIPIFDLAAGGSRIILNEEVSRSSALAFSPDGRLLAASTNRDGEILLWDLAAGRVRTRLRGRFPALDLAFSSDGRSIAVGERVEERVNLWDIDTGRGRSIFSGSSGGITSVAFSPDGGLLAAAGPTARVVRLWKLPSGRLQLRIPGHAGGSNAVRFSPAGGLLFTSGCDGMVRIWKVATGEPIASLDGHSVGLPRLSLSADGRMIAAAGFDNHVRVWNLDDVNEIRVDRARRRLGSAHRDLPMPFCFGLSAPGFRHGPRDSPWLISPRSMCARSPRPSGPRGTRPAGS